MNKKDGNKSETPTMVLVFICLMSCFLVAPDVSGKLPIIILLCAKDFLMVVSLVNNIVKLLNVSKYS